MSEGPSTETERPPLVLVYQSESPAYLEVL